MKPQPPRARRLLIPLALVLLACPVARAQAARPQTQNPAAGDRATARPAAQAVAPGASRPVRLSVIVSDKTGAFVGDLRREDFRVEEDGVAQSITHFAVEESPVSYTLVVDNSGSLRSVLEHLLGAGAALVSANRPGDETSLTRFVGRDNVKVLRDFTADEPALMSGLASMYVEAGQTAVIDAIYLSAQRVVGRRIDEGGRRRRALVLLTDGEDRASRYRPGDLHDLLRRLDVQVFVIGITTLLPNEGIIRNTRGKATNFLKSLAQETGGRAFFPKNAGELQDAANHIARDLRRAYSINYQPSKANPDGKLRKIQVKLVAPATRGKLTVHARSGYFAPGAKGEGKKEPKEKSSRLEFR